jgi:hypothetical protein
MRKRGLYTDAEGNLHIIIPLYDDPMRPSGMTDEEYFEFARDKLLIAMGAPEGAVVGEFDERNAPTDRTFRDAWEAPSGSSQYAQS